MHERTGLFLVELEDTVQAGFSSISLYTIRRFANRSQWIDAYFEGLNEKQQNLHIASEALIGPL